jgi:hypothetical protein
VKPTLQVQLYVTKQQKRSYYWDKLTITCFSQSVKVESVPMKRTVVLSFENHPDFYWMLIFTFCVESHCVMFAFDEHVWFGLIVFVESVYEVEVHTCVSPSSLCAFFYVMSIELTLTFLVHKCTPLVWLYKGWFKIILVYLSSNKPSKLFTLSCLPTVFLMWNQSKLV